MHLCGICVAYVWHMRGMCHMMWVGWYVGLPSLTLQPGRLRCLKWAKRTRMCHADTSCGHMISTVSDRLPSLNASNKFLGLQPHMASAVPDCLPSLNTSNELLCPQPYMASAVTERLSSTSSPSCTHAGRHGLGRVGMSLLAPADPQHVAHAGRRAGDEGAFVLRAFSSAAFELEQLPSPLSLVLGGSWVGHLAGGGPQHATFGSNPQYMISCWQKTQVGHRWDTGGTQVWHSICYAWLNPQYTTSCRQKNGCVHNAGCGKF